ncbi:hypothetical protein NTGBS_710003 [Candidatus Nitrotoga sp. BS]|uniref:hypothetical protein n=1 Tax=Candidatus Nitrotoga sp. BS TaxID=2890408 RepID=UPI001EF38705|nr:hypothetical protein [Candidatus Nitrotoga sp. BS]CAH1207834.1 hypothetical protein NTGBS_710003 [Candidatus Nitrotoga sp. BS]
MTIIDVGHKVGQTFYLLKYRRQAMPVVNDVVKGHGTYHNMTIPSFDDGDLGTGFVFLMFLAFSHTINVRLIKTLKFAFIPALLIEDTLVKGEIGLLLGECLFGKLTLHFTQ